MSAPLPPPLLVHRHAVPADDDSLKSKAEDDFVHEVHIRDDDGSEYPRSLADRSSFYRPDFFDPNYDSDADAFEDDSPYPEVRSAVANFDDPDMPCSTIRSWTLGLFWSILLPGINQFFNYRYPTIMVPVLVALLITWPLGRLWHRFMPAVALFGHALNPGPFTIKEHVLVMIMSGVGVFPAYASLIITSQRVYYNQNWSFTYQWCLVTSTNLIGLGAGGIARRFLVTPASMIWPGTLVSSALFNTLHSQQYVGMGQRKGPSRETLFFWLFLASFLYYFLPGYLFSALSYFSWVCWIAPDNVKLNQLFGYRSGLGMSLLTFDWAQITDIGSPLVTPWWATANIIVGFVVVFWVITPILYYTNTFSTQYLPLSSHGLFDNTGGPYNLMRILNADATINMDAYRAYSPVFLSASFILAYAVAFTSQTAIITHAIVYFWHPIKMHFKRSTREQPDIHARLMSAYPEVPDWWYLTIFAINFVLAIITIEVWPTQLPIWGLVLALAMGLLYLIPIGMIQAVTNKQLGISVISEMVIGYLLPGKPVANMLFKTYSYIAMSQSLVFTSDFKLGHYMKINPRHMFWAQLVAAILSGTVQLGIQSWMFSNISDLCQTTQRHGFTCASQQTFASASIFWGVVGPKLEFSAGRIYNVLLFFFIFGALAPVVIWLLARRYPGSWINYINFPLILGGLDLIPPATSINYVPWAIIGFIFQYIIRRHHFPFWAKYNYVLSAALDAGTAAATVFIFFCLVYPRNGTIGESWLSWWGNTVFTNTADWNNVPLKVPPPGETFGPKSW